MQIRKAIYNDVRRISYLIKKNADNVLVKDYTQEQLSAWKSANSFKRIKESMTNRTTFVAFQNNRLIGTIGLEDDYVVGLYISYSKRGKGLGYQLLKYIEEYAKKKNINQLYLTSTPNGYDFYLKNGYKDIGIAILNYDGVEVKEAKMTKALNK